MGSCLRRQAKCRGIKSGREWGFKEEMSACLLQSHGETLREKGNAVFCPCFSIINLWLILPTRWCLLCIKYGLYKNEKKIWQVNVVYHCGNSDQMALPSVDFLNPLPLCLFVLIFKLVEIPSSLSYAPINKKRRPLQGRRNEGYKMK